MKNLYIMPAILFSLMMSGPVIAQEQSATSTAAAPAQTAVTTTRTIEIKRLPDGRIAYIFGGTAPLPDFPENAEKITLPDGRTAYAVTPVLRDFIPLELTDIIKKSDEPAVLTTGLISNKQTVAKIGYTYKKTFRMKSDIVFKPLFGSAKVTVAKGAIGFYSGKYKMAQSNEGGPDHIMLCVFNTTNKNPYEIPDCYLGALPLVANDLFIKIGTYMNIPRSFGITTQYGKQIYNFVEGFEIEDGDFKIGHDFALILSVNKWRKEGVELYWKSEGSTVSSEIIPLNADGMASLAVNGGILTMKPDPSGDSDKTLVSFISKAETAAVKPQ